jgi:hypothetical protein
MPSFYIHMSVADHVSELLGGLDRWPRETGPFSARGFSGPEPNELAELAEKHPNYFALGAIGPDLFFSYPTSEQRRASPSPSGTL